MEIENSLIWMPARESSLAEGVYEKGKGFCHLGMSWNKVICRAQGNPLVKGSVFFVLIVALTPYSPPLLSVVLFQKENRH